MVLFLPFPLFYIIYNDDVLVLTVGCFSIIYQIQLVVNYNVGINTIMVKAVFYLSRIVYLNSTSSLILMVEVTITPLSNLLRQTTSWHVFIVTFRLLLPCTFLVKTVPCTWNTQDLQKSEIESKRPLSMITQEVTFTVSPEPYVLIISSNIFLLLWTYLGIHFSVTCTLSCHFFVA